MPALPNGTTLCTGSSDPRTLVLEKRITLVSRHKAACDDDGGHKTGQLGRPGWPSSRLNTVGFPLRTVIHDWPGSFAPNNSSYGANTVAAPAMAPPGCAST